MITYMILDFLKIVTAGHSELRQPNTTYSLSVISQILLPLITTNCGSQGPQIASLWHHNIAKWHLIDYPCWMKSACGCSPRSKGAPTHHSTLQIVGTSFDILLVAWCVGLCMRVTSREYHIKQLRDACYEKYLKENERRLAKWKSSSCEKRKLTH